MIRDPVDLDRLDQLEPDIVEIILAQCLALCPGFSAEIARQIETDVRQRHGGRRLFVPKGSKRLTDAERAAVYKDGLTDIPAAEILRKHKISRATLYRTMKTGGRFG